MASHVYCDNLKRSDTIISLRWPATWPLVEKVDCLVVEQLVDDEKRVWRWMTTIWEFVLTTIHALMQKAICDVQVYSEVTSGRAIGGSDTYHRIYGWVHIWDFPIKEVALPPPFCHTFTPSRSHAPVLRAY